MLKRLLSSVLVMCFAATVAHAALRAPQVPVTGTALATFFAAQSQTINVSTLQQLNVPAGTAFEVIAFPGSGGQSFGAYNAVPASPPLYMLFPGGTTNGWHTAMSFRDTPARLVVSLFDAANTLQGSNTFMGADKTAFGFYVQDASSAVSYLQDSRNAAGARILAYNGTGTRTGWTWLACETGAGPGGDFADFVGLVNLSQTGPVSVSRSSWSRIKQLFH
jgi:hypothetical protein